MKTKYLITAGVLAMLASVSAKAQTSYTNGDFFLDVRNLSDASSYLIDIGGGTTPFNFSQNFDVSIAGLTTDLNSVAGTGWATNANVFFSIVGGSVNAPTTELLYATNPTTTVWTAKHNESGFAGDITSLVENYVDNPTNSQSGNAQVLEEANSGNNSYTSFLPTFGQFPSSIEGSVEDSLSFDYLPAGNAASPPGTLEGSFTVDSANNSLDFTTAAVPEPSTIATLVLGAAGLLAVRRRRVQA